MEGLWAGAQSATSLRQAAARVRNNVPVYASGIGDDEVGCVAWGVKEGDQSKVRGERMWKGEELEVGEPANVKELWPRTGRQRRTVERVRNNVPVCATKNGLREG